MCASKCLCFHLPECVFYSIIVCIFGGAIWMCSEARLRNIKVFIVLWELSHCNSRWETWWVISHHPFNSSSLYALCAIFLFPPHIASSYSYPLSHPSTYTPRGRGGGGCCGELFSGAFVKQAYFLGLFLQRCEAATEGTWDVLCLWLDGLFSSLLHRPSVSGCVHRGASRVRRCGTSVEMLLRLVGKS